MHAVTYVCVHGCGGQKSMPGAFLGCSLSPVWGQNLSQDLELTGLASQ